MAVTLCVSSFTVSKNFALDPDADVEETVESTLQNIEENSESEETKTDDAKEETEVEEETKEPSSSDSAVENTSAETDTSKIEDTTTTEEKVEDTETKETPWKLTFVGMDDKVISEIEVKSVEDIVYPEAPEVDGYKFKEWDLQFDDIFMFAANTTVHAVYEKLPAAEDLEERTIEATANGRTFEIEGNLPKEASVSARKVEVTDTFENSVKEAVDNDTITIYEAYDISIMLDGEEWKEVGRETATKRNDFYVVDVRKYSHTIPTKLILDDRFCRKHDKQSRKGKINIQ